jgi:hypothetical protein
MARRFFFAVFMLAVLLTAVTAQARHGGYPKYSPRQWRRLDRTTQYNYIRHRRALTAETRLRKDLANRGAMAFRSRHGILPGQSTEAYIRRQAFWAGHPR